MNAVTTDILNEQIEKFCYEGLFIGAAPYGGGHINDTYAVYFQLESGNTKRYILQRINHNVFRHPHQLMENIISVTAYLRQRIIERGGDPQRETLNLIPTKDGRLYCTDREGACWRSYIFIEDTITYHLVKNPQDFYNSARSFGRFQHLLANYPAHTLHETIPMFHNTVNRIEQLRQAVADDSYGRAAEVTEDIDFVLSRQEDAHILLDGLAEGRLPLRVTHNDTKLNNILFDSSTGKGICIIDLDTVMPGLSLYDFGDSIRFGATTAAEDEKDLSKVHFDLELFDVYTKGYLETAGGILTPDEKLLLPMGAKLMTYECGIRFLADYIAGDVYFKTQRPGQNLDRARTQFKLVWEMEQHWGTMNEIVNKYNR